AIGTLFVSSCISPFFHFMMFIIACALLIFVSYKSSLTPVQEVRSKQPILVLPDKHILVLVLISFCCMICEGAMADWTGVYFKNVVQTPAAYTTVGYVAFTATMATGRFLGDWLVTKLG